MPKKTLEEKSKATSEIEACRVLPIAATEFAECLHSGPNPCSYALPFGYCFLCQHPRLDDIIENSKKAQRSLTYVH